MPRSYVVTGAAGGVGRAIAERLSRDGHVVALDLEPAEIRGIRANAVALGSIANARLDELLAERPEVAEELRALHPLGRAGRAEEVATVVAHLLSEDASFVNGAVVPIDGGRAGLGRDPEARHHKG